MDLGLHVAVLSNEDTQLSTIPKHQRVSLSSYLGDQMDLSDRSDAELAAAIGLRGATVLQSHRTGLLRLGVPRLVALAKLVNADPKYVLQLALHEMSPSLWDIIEIELLSGNKVLTGQESDLIEIAREVDRDCPYDLSDANNRSQLAETIEWVCALTAQSRDAAVRAAKKR